MLAVFRGFKKVFSRDISGYDNWADKMQDLEGFVKLEGPGPCLTESFENLDRITSFNWKNSLAKTNFLLKMLTKLLFSCWIAHPWSSPVFMIALSPSQTSLTLPLTQSMTTSLTLLLLSACSYPLAYSLNCSYVSESYCF